MTDEQLHRLNMIGSALRSKHGVDFSLLKETSITAPVVPVYRIVETDNPEKWVIWDNRLESLLDRTERALITGDDGDA